MKIEFIGATREVTGSKFLITTDEGKRILLDCGMFQGKGLETDAMNRHLGFNPEELDHVILTHAHIDHSGLIPYLYKLGFRGSVICTSATRDLCSIMLVDSGHIQELDNKWFNKKQAKKGLPLTSPIYNVVHAEKCMELFITVAYNRRFYINDNVSVKFTNTGHMLGSAAANIRIREGGEVKNITYTGDIGRESSHLLSPWTPSIQCDYLIAESTYGDRLHEPVKTTEEDLLKIVYETCVERQGKLIIPAFSVGRTQEIVYALNEFHNAGKLPPIEVFVDSPLSVNATDIFRLHMDTMNDRVKETLLKDPNPFGFSSLHYIKDVDESKALNGYKKPCIIISASGMAEAGRIKHHISNNIENPNNTILMVGYCTPTSLGARIQQPGLKEISIFGSPHKVNARIERIEGFSAHGDYREMIDYLSSQDKSKIKQTFLVHGEYNAQVAYKGHLEDAGFQNVEIPEVESVYEL
ncbi:MBL fold metallo-hydrolase [Paludibacter sp. 221]|uniref:MBL fold metallo-hydrolase RNA specificity domain-containing protein n=1 Tax=Paludibacter sp. 221 TaxID=2302939 RepID=UPI0013D8599C|nr:MBL fold metallo-hydrolase [Paludibacter sp. 221]NDV45730.1 MBL fold metallo-hydrolase [Paludibacter sp. 221]